MQSIAMERKSYLKRLHFGFEELSGMNSLLQSCFNLCGTVASLR